ncbi:MAG: hypothetical protein A3F09_06140 [Chlamydiae bacterium RIFCSPHIGHO2_12_FULL_49_11]|nr:MAG: hypothetical protein A3F09_06140 [Chlamydiae bacterium RIFCSPHIGHO2_12_FULL_49_11]
MAYVSPYYFAILSGKAKKLISERPHCHTLSSVNKEETRLVTGEEGDAAGGHWIRFTLLVNTEDGVIADAAYQVFGPASLVLLAEVICKICRRKNYDQARRIGVPLLFKEMDLDEKKAPDEMFTGANSCLFALEGALDACYDIELPSDYIQTPLPVDISSLGDINWKACSLAERKGIISTLIEEQIQPYVSLDEGRVELYDLSEKDEVTVQYAGACTTCHAASGSTLSAIEQILRTHLSDTIRVRIYLPASSPS